MKSIKPGRGPSMMGGVSSIFAALFGVFWTAASSQTGIFFFPLFGVFFTGMAIWNAVYNFKNAVSGNRYSAYDIVDSAEEPDPMNEKFGRQSDSTAVQPGAANFCPYCGAKSEPDHRFCKSCGKKLT